MRATLVSILLVMFVQVFPVYAGGDGVVNVISSNDREVVLELVVPAFQVQPITQEGVTYQRVTLPRFGLTTEVGHPQVPVRGEMIGIPEGAAPVVEIVASEVKTISGYTVAPAPRPEVDEEDGVGVGIRWMFAKNEAVYARDAVYPPSPVRIGLTGKMRDQSVVQILFSPIQANPARHEVHFFTRLLVRVGFEGARSRTLDKPEVHDQAVPHQVPPQDRGYDHLLKDLLFNAPSASRSNDPEGGR